MQIERVAVDVVRPLRHTVLRPNQPASSAVFAEDDALPAVHLAAFEHDVVVGVASVYLQDSGRANVPERSGRAWRLRGMATGEAVRGCGYGAAIVRAVLAFVAERDGTILWCNARAAAVGFYERLGLRVEGAPFEIRGIGPHSLMWREIVTLGSDAP